MKAVTSRRGLGMLFAAAVLSSTVIATADEAGVRVATANNAFAVDLYGALAKTEGNLFFSPSSIETALAMTYAGARGETAQQMAAVLHLPAKDDAIQAEFGSFLNALNNPKGSDGQPRGYQLLVANALWGQKGYEFLPDFVNLLSKNYGAGLNVVDFKTDAEGARNTINAWVEKKTQEKIKDLIRPGVLNSLTRLVLTNAIYFKGTWADPFEKNSTENAPFHLTAKTQEDVPMMHRTGDYEYSATDDLQVLKLPYKGFDVAMIILLPRKVDGVKELEANMAGKDITSWLAHLDEVKVVVSLPKFTSNGEFELADTLKGLGMTDAFGGDADFSGMDGKRDFLISGVIHKAFVDVNEEGTEVAAATGVVMEAAAAMPFHPPEVFTADHPFIYLIQDERSGAILFMGRMADPGKAP